MDFKSVILVSVIALSACSSGDKIAKVGEKTISQQEFDAHLVIKRIGSDQESAVNAEFDRFLNQTALAQAVLEQEELELALVDAEVEIYRKQMIISRYMSEYLDRAVTDAAIENYYTANKEQYSQNQANVAHIVFRVHNAMTDIEKKAALQNARDVAARLSLGEDFQTLAKARSEDVNTSDKGGELGWLNTDAIDPDFSRAVSELDVGQVSDVVKTQFGYHIIKLLEPIRTDYAPLNQVRGDIRYELRQKAKDAETARLLESIEVSRAD